MGRGFEKQRRSEQKRKPRQEPDPMQALYDWMERTEDKRVDPFSPENLYKITNRKKNNLENT